MRKNNAKYEKHSHIWYASIISFSMIKINKYFSYFLHISLASAYIYHECRQKYGTAFLPYRIGQMF